MHVGRASEANIMTDFENFYRDLLELAKKYEQRNVPLKIEQDLENDVIKIFGFTVNFAVLGATVMNLLHNLAKKPLQFLFTPGDSC